MQKVKDYLNLPILENASLEQALRWIVDGFPPLDIKHEELMGFPEVFNDQFYGELLPNKEYIEAAQELIKHLAMGKISSMGCCRDTEKNEQVAEIAKIKIPASCWGKVRDWSQIKFSINGKTIEQPFINFDELSDCFPADLKYRADLSVKPKKGRPPIFPKELWMSELIKLLLSETVLPSDPKESIAREIIKKIQKETGRSPNLNTVTKDWLRPLFQEVIK